MKVDYRTVRSVTSGILHQSCILQSILISGVTFNFSLVKRPIVHKFVLKKSSFFCVCDNLMAVESNFLSVYDFPDRVFLKHKSKTTSDCYVFKFLRRSVDAKHLVRFHSETSVFKFLRRTVGPTLNPREYMLALFNKTWTLMFPLTNPSRANPLLILKISDLPSGYISSIYNTLQNIGGWNEQIFNRWWK